MSLTSLVKNASPVRDRLAELLPKPRLPLTAKLQVPSKAKNPSHIGTAYDYLLRFHLEREMPFSQRRSWVAERSCASLQKRSEVQIGDRIRSAGPVLRKMRAAIHESKSALYQFLNNKKSADTLAECALNLSHCDLLYRIGRLDKRFGLPALRSELAELRRLIEITDFEALKGTSVCYLNPTFGAGSIRLGGADADILIDDLLIDVKTSSQLRVRIEDWRQLIAYAALNEYFPIGGGDRPARIRHIGVYFSRHGYLARWPLRHIVEPAAFAEFALWLAEFVTERHRDRVLGRARLIQNELDCLEQERRKYRQVRKKREEEHKSRRERLRSLKLPPSIERARVKCGIL